MNLHIVNIYHKVVTRFLRTLQWLLGASTVGVRTLVVNDSGQVLLIKHTYMEGWHFPGGGVFSAEPARVAAIRELREESGLNALGEIELFGVYFHKVMRANDYIVLYVVKQFTQTDFSVGGEIAAVAWFSLDNLPDDISNSTHTRIHEYFHNQAITDQW